MKKYTVIETYNFYDGYLTLTATRDEDDDNDTGDVYWLFAVDAHSDERHYHVTKLPRFLEDMKNYSVLEIVSEKEISFTQD